MAKREELGSNILQCSRKQPILMKRTSARPRLEKLLTFGEIQELGPLQFATALPHELGIRSEYRFVGTGKPRCSRRVNPEYSRRKMPRLCSSGTTESMNSSKAAEK